MEPKLSRRQFGARWPLLLAACCLGAAFPIEAQPARKDDARLIQALMDKLPAEGGLILLPLGEYNFFQSVVVKSGRIQIRGL